MAHLIVKDRKLCMVNGRFVTSANGAPCVCGGEPTDPGPCDGFAGPLPFEPCAIRVSFAGIQSAFGYPECGNSQCTPQSRGVLAASGINRSFVLQDGSGTGTSRTFSGRFPALVIRETTGGSTSDGVCLNNQTVWNEVLVAANVFFCSSNDRWYITRLNMSLQGPSQVAVFGFDTSIGSRPDEVALGFPVDSTVPDNVAGCVGGLLNRYHWGGDGFLSAILGDCTNTEDENTYVYEAVRCDGQDSIWVDIRGATGHKAIYQGDLYTVTDTYSSTATPVTVDGWTDEDCPQTTGGDLFERCTPQDDGFPERVRGGANMDGSNYGRSTLATPDPSPAYPNCEVVRVVGYQRIDDDGGTYPDAINMTPSVGPCSSVRDYTYRRFCGMTDAGGPQDPNNPAITDPGIQRTLPIQDLSGYDIEREINAARQGGCCGSPTK